MTETTKKIIEKTNGLKSMLIGLLIAVPIGIIGLTCTPVTRSPMDPSRMVNARELNIEYQVWVAEQSVYQKKFELGAEDIDAQAKQFTSIGTAIQNLAAGGVPDVPGLIQLLLGAGFAGLLVDNIRRPKTIVNNQGRGAE